jgi:hypothetical protein
MRKMMAAFATLALAGSVLAGCSKAEPTKEQPKAAEQKNEQKAAATSSFTGKSADGKLEVKVTPAGEVASVEMKAKDWKWNATFASKEPKDPKNAAGEGHAILVLDGKEPIYVGSVRTALNKLTKGKHTLKVSLVNNDNTPLSPAVEATVEFEVK